MTRTVATPQPHSVFNEFDRQGLLINLPRISRERNPSYKRRLMDVFVNRSSSTRQGLVNGITRELGLSIIEAMTVTPVKDGDGVALLSDPAIVFEETKCILYSDWMAGTVFLSIDRYNRTAGAWTLGELTSVINATGYFTATLLEDAESQKQSMTIFDQGSAVWVPSEDISSAGSVIVLENQNILSNSVTVRSSTMTRQVATEAELNFPGAYMVKPAEGVLLTVGAPSPGSSIRYAYRNDSFIAKASPVIFHNLQSDDFKSKMFETDGVESGFGLPTTVGADIINELMSVYPASWGE